MRVIHLFVLHLLSTYTLFAQNTTIKIQVLDDENKSPIPYATVVEYNSKTNGTITDEKGFFELKIKILEESQIYISSVGYKDTIISASIALDLERILLKPDINNLGSFIIKATATETTELGNSKAIINEKNNYQASLGFYWGVYFNTKKKEIGGILDKVNIYINKMGFPETPLLMRIFEFTGEFEFFRSQPKYLFKELTREPIIMRNNNFGWNELDVSHLNITVPSSGLYVLFTPVGTDEEYQYETISGLKFGSTIGIYSDNKDSKRIFPVLQDRDRISVMKKSRAPTPAVSIIISNTN